MTQFPVMQFEKIRSVQLTRRFVAPFALGLLILLSYAAALRIFFLSDDYILLTEAQSSNSFSSIFPINSTWFFYRPLGKLLWFAEFHLFGYHGVLYHFISLGMHWLNSLLVIALVRRTFPAAAAAGLAAGVLFALLPLNTEAAVWLASQYDLLATLFYLATLLCLLHAWQGNGRGWYLLSLGSYQLCLWSKETAFTLPLLALALALCLRPRPRARYIAFAIVPYDALLSINLLQRFLTWGNIGGYANSNASALDLLWPRVSSTLLFLLAPFNRLRFSSSFIIVWLIVLGALLLLGLFARPQPRMLGLGFVWLIVTLMPVFGVLPIGADLQNNRLLYLPAIGFCIGLAALLDATRRYHQQVFYTSVIVLCSAYVISLQFQLQPWRVAGQAAIHVVQEVHRLMPYFPPGSEMQVAGLPDNYQGAYIYRLGFDHAVGHLYHSTFALESVPKLPPFAYDHAANSYQVAFAPDAGEHTWQITAARAVTAPDERAATEEGEWQHWDVRACAQHGWHMTEDATCGNDTSIILPQRAAITSPPLDLDGTKWIEVRVGIATFTGDANDGAVQLQWSHTDAPAWGDAPMQRINLPGDGSQRNYHFFIRPDGSGQPVCRLRLTATSVPTPITISAIAARQVP